MPAASGQRDTNSASLRLVLRGIGGQHHGRSICLEQPRRIGRGSDVDIRIEGPGIGEHHAVVEAINGQAVLRDAQADVLVNGHRTRQAILQAGDQIAFDVQHRFVVEGPPPQAAAGTHVRSQQPFVDEAEERPLQLPPGLAGAHALVVAHGHHARRGAVRLAAVRRALTRAGRAAGPNVQSIRNGSASPAKRRTIASDSW